MKFVDGLLVTLARLAVFILCILSVRAAAAVGRFGGGLAYHLDARHRRVAIRNLTLTFENTKSPAEIASIARENFKRIGENICAAIKLSSLPPGEVTRFVNIIETGSERSAAALCAHNVVLASGHFGSFELFAHISRRYPQYRHVTTYRGIRQPRLDQYMRRLRSGTGITMLDRRDATDHLKHELSAGGVMLILFADQSDRKNGVELPFLGRPAFTNRAPAIMAARYDCSLFAPICYRLGPGSYRIEMGEPIATRDSDGRRRTCEAITRDINAAHEAAILRDPANWFWVHNRWKAKAENKRAIISQQVSQTT
jgi:KDO2-lipid IV(A) lauroyltransferase